MTLHKGDVPAGAPRALLAREAGPGGRTLHDAGSASDRRRLGRDAGRAEREPYRSAFHRHARAGDVLPIPREPRRQRLGGAAAVSALLGVPRAQTGLGPWGVLVSAPQALRESFLFHIPKGHVLLYYLLVTENRTRHGVRCFLLDYSIISFE